MFPHRDSFPNSHPTFKEIVDRLLICGINIKSYIAGDLVVHSSSLEGISFKVNQINMPLIPLDLKTIFARSRTPLGQLAFREGPLSTAKHWAFDLSLLVTKGTGFREIWRPQLSTTKLLDPYKSPKNRNKPSLDNVFSNRFDQSVNRVDISSLHCAIFKDFCSIHVDKTGFTMEALPGWNIDVALTADLFTHVFDELLFKDILKFPAAADLIIPDSSNAYSRIGLRGTAPITGKVNLSAQTSCRVHGKFECSSTVNLFGKF